MKNLCAKFEKWPIEIQQTDCKNASEKPYIKTIDTTKNLKTMFELLNEENKPVENPRLSLKQFVVSKRIFF